MNVHHPKSLKSRCIWVPMVMVAAVGAQGAAPVVTLQPVPPKTLPASSYPAGSSIAGQTLTLGSVPARIWIDVHVSGWTFGDLVGSIQVTISGTDSGMGGGGFSGAAADCAGYPAFGAGDLIPAMQPCTRFCENRPSIPCTANATCRLCVGGANDGIPCTSSSNCPGGSCPSASAARCGNAVCQNEISGGSCGAIEPSRCVTWDGVFPAGYFPAGQYCMPVFQNVCQSNFVGLGTSNWPVVDISTLKYRFVISGSHGEMFEDFHPSYLGTVVLDVPANAKGAYTIDVDESNTVMEAWSCHPYTPIPIVDFQSAIIKAPCDSLATQAKTRFLAVRVPTGLSPVTALRVKLISLHHVDPPYSGGPSVPFTAFEFGAGCQEAGGCVRWIGPPVEYVESTASGVPFYAATLQCTPHYQDWSSVRDVFVSGSAIVPNSVYEVEALDSSCIGNEENCAAVSAPLTFSTTRWGDVETPFNPPSTATQPDLGDVASLVNKFKNVPGAPIKARALLAGDDAFGNISPLTLSLDLGFGHIAACVDAFKGKPYPHTIQACP